MYQGKVISLIIPAKNEALALPHVLGNVPDEIDHVLVIDNGSTDDTALIAAQHGAKVILESMTGYGAACLAGIKALGENPPDIVAFADADGSDDLTCLLTLLAPLTENHVDLVLERRVPTEQSALSIQQRFGNRLATLLIRLLWGHTYGDLGPMRAIQWRSLQKLSMRDRSYGWTVEMQIRALKIGLRVREYPIPYRRRLAGRSKVSGTLAGSVKAGIKILSIIFREAVWR
jgi:glycosyltransferase involved in cell wall biosynthesis